MKRFVTFALTVCLLASSLLLLASCGHRHTLDEGALVLPTTSIEGVKKVSSCTGCDETREVVIPFGETTKEKWQKLLFPTNYTVDISYAGNDGCYVVTESGYLMTDSTYGFVQYYLEEDDGWYSVALVEGEYKSHKIAIVPDLSLGALIMPGMEEAFYGFPNNENWSFEYSEEWSAYIHTRETNKYFFFIADDTLVKIIGFGAEDIEALKDVTPESEPSEEYSIFVFDFHSYGTTELDRPDYR